MTWKRVQAPEQFVRMWTKQYGTVPVPTFYARGKLRALVGREPAGRGEPRWHISVSAEDRLPTWNELVNSAHTLRPGVPFAIGIPPLSWWINVHPHTLHLWELRDPFLVAQWREESRGDRPT